MMKRCRALAAGIALAALTAAPAVPARAAEGAEPGSLPAGEVQQGPPAEVVPAPETPVAATPQAVVDWYNKQLQRMEQRKRAAAMRQLIIQGGEGQPAEPAQ